MINAGLLKFSQRFGISITRRMSAMAARAWSAVLRQRRDPGYHLVRVLPEGATLPQVDRLAHPA